MPVPTDIAPDPPVATRLLRVTEVSTEVGLTPRAVRYYEELGLLNPAARSGGDYRLYDEDDVARLRFIRGLRDDAGFSLAEIGRLLEDEAMRERNRARFRSTTDTAERRGILVDAVARIDRQVATLRDKESRLRTMIEEAETRRTHLQGHLQDLDAGREHAHPPAPPRGTKP
ncbi:MAG: MerR family transcriptional regulator [Candidatus Limnocylindrales bacterium]